MKPITRRFDPWGPISTVLYDDINNSEFVLSAIANTGIHVDWRPLTKQDAFSNSTRIRVFRQDINNAYRNLTNEGKGLFTQIVVKALLNRFDGSKHRTRLIDLLHDIGWTISDSELLHTEDALISEQFFPPNSEYDAYVAIRDIFVTASQNIIVLDAYVGSSLLLTLKALFPPRKLCVMVLTVGQNLKADFRQEAASFRKQVSHITLEVRTMNSFHDRFIVIDGDAFYHVGASIKDAGNRAFMLSRIEDQTNIDGLKQSISQAWTSGTVLQ